MKADKARRSSGSRGSRRGPAVRFAPKSDAAPISDSEAQANARMTIVHFCKAIGEQMTGKVAARAAPTPAAALPDVEDARFDDLSPRVQQTLIRMLAGDSEKEIGIFMGVSRHTVHVYVKALYRRFEVNSRGELLAHFVKAIPRSPAKYA